MVRTFCPLGLILISRRERQKRGFVPCATEGKTSPCSYIAQQSVCGRGKHGERRTQLIKTANRHPLFAQAEHNKHLLFNLIVSHSVRDLDSTHLNVFRIMSTVPLCSAIVY